jgi:outer membrane protein assembly factor BamB
MTNNDSASARRPLRTWPVLAIAALYAAIVMIGPMVSDDISPSLALLLGGVVSALLLIVWWMFFSRAPWFERIGVLALMAIAVAVTRMGVDISIAGGAQGGLGYILGVVCYAAAIGVWAVVTSGKSDQTRRLALIPVLLVVGLAPMLAIRTEGIMGGGFLLAWRWTPTAEERLLALGEEPLKPLAAPVAAAEPVPASAAPATELPVAAPVNTTPLATTPAAPPVAEMVVEAEWPGFRGPSRDGVIRHVQIKTDWNQSPPTQMWRRPIGPGWSSFSVRGDLLYTQEQRGEEEIVGCYRVSTGEPVWRHRDPIRFYESNGGAGPRGTPTIDGNRIFALGATGMLNALDAATGKVLWQHNAATDTKREVPMWGISSSPLVVDDHVIVSLYGTLAAYDKATGALKWIGPLHGGSYSSPHLLTVNGVRQVVILSAPGAVSVNPKDGSLFWEHKWEGGAIVQPGITPEGDILINGMAATGGLGTRRLAVKQSSDAWQVEERWTSNGLKPYFNDLVIHKGHAYGFDGAILSAIDLSDGKRKWKGGRYGQGQMLVLADQDLLLVISEEGELALVSATPDQYKELARIPALNAKTWNHPVIVNDVLLIRNGEEMVAYRLPLAGAATADR